MRVAGIQDIERAAQAFASIIAEHLCTREPGLHEGAVTDDIARELLLAAQDAVDMFTGCPDAGLFEPLPVEDAALVRAFMARLEQRYEADQ